MHFSVIILLFLSHLVFGTRDDIAISIGRTTWLSDQHFGAVIKYSYTTATCCNVLVDKRSRGVNKILKQFINLYGDEYTTGVIDYACQSYFLLSSSQDNLIDTLKLTPTSLSTSEILIVINSNLTNHSQLLNVTRYGYSNVNIISQSYTWSLSENYLKPRVFKLISRYEDMKRKGGVVNLQGRQLQVGTHYRPPSSYLLTAVRRTVDGIETDIFVEKNESELAGVETQIFMIIAEKMNFTWMTRRPIDGFTNGKPNGTVWHTGLIGQIFKKEIDLAYCRIYLQQITNCYVNLSFPWHQLTVNFLVPRPRPIISIWALSRPLSGPVWIVLVLTVCVQALAVCWSAKIISKIPKRFRSYVHTIIELIGRLLGTWTPEEMTGLRVQMNMWHFFGVLIVTAYSSNLSATLTDPDYEARIDHIQQFVEANLTWGRQKNISNFSDYVDLNDKYAKQMVDRYELETSDSMVDAKIRRGNYAIFGQMMNHIFFPENNIDNSHLKNYRVMKDATARHFVSFVAQSWLLSSINIMIMRLNENGLTGLHLQRVIDKRVSLNLREVFIEKDSDSSDEAVALRLKPLAAAFMLLCAGNLMATVVFYFELKKKKDVKDRRFLACNRNKLVFINQEFKAIRGLKEYKQIYMTQKKMASKKMVD